MAGRKISKVVFVSVGRSDIGIIRPVIEALNSSGVMSAKVLVSGAHFSAEHGRTSEEIYASAIPVYAEARTEYDGDTAADMAMAMGRQTLSVATVLKSMDAESLPDIVFLTGDRFETLAAATAFLPYNITLAHLHGGELSYGAVDDSIRHALTKLSHLHFVSTVDADRRVRQMGEEPWRVERSGAPALDGLKTVDLATRDMLSDFLALPAIRETDPIVVTVHPETIGHIGPEQLATEILFALGDFNQPMVITYPNADPGSQEIAKALEAFCDGRQNTSLVRSLGASRYFGLLSIASAMVGNSSSGIIEAASFGLPVVNVGDRQAGRSRAENVIDCPVDAASVASAIADALAPSFRAQMRGMTNPYGDGNAAAAILRKLGSVTLDDAFYAKKFDDI